MQIPQQGVCDVWHQILSNLSLSQLALLSRLSHTWYQHTSISLHSNYHTNTSTSRIYTTWLINAICFDIHRKILKADSQFYKMFDGYHKWFNCYKRMYNNNVVIDVLNNKISSSHKSQFFIKIILPFIAIECDRYLLLIQNCNKQDIFTLNAIDSRYSRSKTKESINEKNMNKFKKDLEWYNKNKSSKTQILLKHVKYQVDKMIENNYKTPDKTYKSVSYNIGCVLRLINYIGELINQLKRQFIGINKCIGSEVNHKKYPYKCEYETSGIYLKLFEVFNYFNHVALTDKHSQQRSGNVNIYKYYTIELLFKLILSEFGDKIDLISDIDVKLHHGTERWIEFEQHRNNKSFNGHDWFDFTLQLARSNRDILLNTFDWYSPFACYSISKRMSEYEEKTPGSDSTYMPRWRLGGVQTTQDYQQFRKANLYKRQPKYFHAMTRFNHFQMYKLCCLNTIDYNYYNTIGIFRNGIVLTMYILSNSKTMGKWQRKTRTKTKTTSDEFKFKKNILQQLVVFDGKYNRICPQRLTRYLYRGRFGASLHVFQTAYFSFRSAMFLIEYELSLKHVDKKYGYLFLKHGKESVYSCKQNNSTQKITTKQEIFLNKLNAIRDNDIGNTFDGMIAVAFLSSKRILIHRCKDLDGKNIFVEKKIIKNGLRMRRCVKRSVKGRFMLIEHQFHINACG